MLLTYRRYCIPGILGILLLTQTCSAARADGGFDCEFPAARGTYIGIFGGAGICNIGSISQVGTILFTEATGGPLVVNATGQPATRGVGLAGLHIGHEWSHGSILLPAVEIEGLYLAGTQRATLNSPNKRIAELQFDTTFPMDSGVFLGNFVLGVQTPWRLVTPYVGGGVGVACISINGANSSQTNPPEPGINHFNSLADSSACGFAAQFKAGARLALGNRAYVFAEYRYLYLGSTTFQFGPTTDPTHAPTTGWTVHVNDMSHHLAVGGIGFKF